MPASFPSRLLLPVIALAVLSIGWAVATPAVSSTALSGDGPDLHDIMKAMKKSLKIIGTSLQDPAADAQVLAAVGEMQVLLLAAKRHDPSNLNEVPRADRKAHTAAFRADIAKTLIETLNLEIAVLEGRRDEAMGYVMGSLKDMRDAGHDKYEPDDD
jgi:hypothetical protein